MPEWIDPAPSTTPEALREAVGGHPLVAELLARRGIRSPEEARRFMDPGVYKPSPPGELPDLKKGARRVEQAIENKETILVWGDFDVDGQTSTALLVSALSELGGRVSYHVPRRETESHGVNVPNLKCHIEKGVQLVLTCDTGVASHEALRFARREGVDVVVTDHHDLPPELPDAEAIINPKRLEKDHPLRTLPGVGVAYKLAEALFEKAGLDPSKHLDLVALGIVADIAHLQGDTRHLLQLGISVLQSTVRPGLLAIMENAGVPVEAADEEDIGYRIAPRLNALGRLADASPAVELLTTESPGRACELAGRLEELNDRRRLLTDQVYEAAKRQLEKSPELLQYAVLVLFDENWPAGVIGIVAGRLAEEFHKPTIFMTASESAMARGSARSIEGLDISAAIAEQSGLLESYGGHPMAAGLTLPSESIGRFRRLVSRSIVRQKGDGELKPTLQIDAYVPLEELTLELADEIRRLAPFGPGNRPVTLACRRVEAQGVEEIGASGKHLKVRVTGGEGVSRKVLYWNATKRDVPSGTFDLAVTLSDNTFRGERTLQLTWLDARPQGVRLKKQPSEAQPRQIVDHRASDDQSALLKDLSQREGLQVWLEALEISGVRGRDRTDLIPCRELAVGTLPPSRSLLKEAIARCNPEVVHVVGLDPRVDRWPDFIRRFLGLAKHAVKTQKRFSLGQLAAAMGHESKTIELGLSWLESQGRISINRTEEGTLLQEGKHERGDAEELRRRLGLRLEEAQAFRRYLLREDLQAMSL